MSDIALSGLNLNRTEDIKLRGITWSDKVKRVDDSAPSQQQVSIQNDQSNVTRVNTGRVPSGNVSFDINDIPDIPTQQTTKEPSVKVGKKEEGVSTGIGMAIGAVGGAIAGKYIMPGAGFSKGMKLGALVGLAVGGFIGNRFEK